MTDSFQTIVSPVTRRHRAAGRALLLASLSFFGLGTSAALAQDLDSLGELKLTPKGQDLAEPSNDPKAVEILDRYLEAIGGTETLDAIQDKTMTFETTKYAESGDTTAKLKLYRKRGTKIREEWDIPGFNIKDQPLKFVQVYDGVDGFVQMFGTVSPLEGRTLSIFVWDKPIDDFFVTWKEDGYSVTYVNEGTVGDEEAHIVQTTDFTGKNKVRYFFSKESGLLLKKEWREQGRDGYVMKEDYHLNYRDIPFADDSGRKLKVALLHRILEDGNPDTERRYLEVTFNTGLADAIFDRPQGIAFQGRGSGSALDRALEKAGGLLQGGAEEAPEGSSPKSSTAPGGSSAPDGDSEN